MNEAPKISVRSLRGVLIGGAIWMVAARWGIRLIGMVSTMILARLLVPEDFGLVAMASIVIGFVDIFFAFGVDTALLQDPRAGRDQFDTAWTVKIVQGLLISAALIAVAPLAAAYFKEPRIADVLMVLCIAIVVGSLGNIGVVKFRKELRFEKEFQLMLVGRLLGFAVTVTAAFLLRSYWALVIGQVVGAVLGCMLTYLMHPYRPRLSTKALKEIGGFSYWMLLVNMSYYALTKVDEVVVGGAGNGSAMGLYSVASEIAELPTTELAFPLSRTLLPGYALLKDEPGRLREAFLNVHGFVATVAVGASLGVAVIADRLVPVLLGNKWLETIPFIQCLALFAAVRAIYGGPGNLLIVLGKVKQVAYLQWTQFALTAAAVIGGMQAFGLIGVALGKLAVAPVFFVLLFGAVTSVSSITRKDIVARLWRPLLSGLAMVLSFAWFPAVAPASDLLAMLLGITFGALVYAGTLLLLWYVCGRPKGAESFLLEVVAKGIQRR